MPAQQTQSEHRLLACRAGNDPMLRQLGHQRLKTRLWEDVERGMAGSPWDYKAQRSDLDRESCANR